MEKIWLKNYKPAIPSEIKQDGTTLVDMFESACQQYAHNRAISCHGVTLSFREVHQAVRKLAQGLADLGLKSADRVALILPNSLQYPLSVFAILSLGASVVNINPLYTAAEIAYILQDSEPKLVICMDMFAEKLNTLYDKYQIEHIILTKMADPYPWFKRNMIGLFLRFFTQLNPHLSYQPKKWFDLFNYPQQLTQLPPLDCNALAFLQYTGATTGRPKGAMLLHRNIVANVRQVFAVIEAQILDMDKQVVINALPLYHIFSLTANLFTFFLHGSENVMVPNAKNIKDLVRTMNNTPFSVFSGLDTLYQKLLEDKAFTAANHLHYKYGICGGMAIRKSVVVAWAKQTGLTPPNCYGLTETSPCVSMSYFDEEFSGSVGYPVPSTEIQIRAIDDHEQVLEVDQTGLIFIRGPQVMQGYWRNPEQTAQYLSSDGWLNSGDIGYINQSGQLSISSRETEMIKVSGFNLYPAEVERVIDELIQVKEVAIVGYVNQATGEAAHAFIVLACHQQLSRRQILHHCRKSLTKYKIPRSITIVSQLPKTAVGKIDKKAIVATYLALK